MNTSQQASHTIRHANRVTRRPARTAGDGGSLRYRSRSVALAAAQSRRYDPAARADAIAGRTA